MGEKKGKTSFTRMDSLQTLVRLAHAQNLVHPCPRSASATVMVRNVFSVCTTVGSGLWCASARLWRPATMWFRVWSDRHLCECGWCCLEAAVWSWNVVSKKIIIFTGSFQLSLLLISYPCVYSLYFFCFQFSEAARLPTLVPLFFESLRSKP